MGEVTRALRGVVTRRAYQQSYQATLLTCTAKLETKLEAKLKNKVAPKQSKTALEGSSIAEYDNNASPSLQKGPKGF